MGDGKFDGFDFSESEDVPDEAGKPEAAPSGGRRKKAGSDSAKLEAYDWIQCVVSAMVFGIMAFLFLLRVVYVDGGSMKPTLLHNDQLITSNFLYTPKAGDVVVLRADGYGRGPLVKRIIATGGQTVDIDFDAGIVYVDGAALEEPYVNGPTTVREDFEGPVKVPEGCLFVLGDNRGSSTDSRDRDVGMVDERCVIGRVLGILIPAADGNNGRDWTRIGSIYD